MSVRGPTNSTRPVECSNPEPIAITTKAASTSDNVLVDHPRRVRPNPRRMTTYFHGASSRMASAPAACSWIRSNGQLTPTVLAATPVTTPAASSSPSARSTRRPACRFRTPTRTAER